MNTLPLNFEDEMSDLYELLRTNRDRFDSVVYETLEAWWCEIYGDWTADNVTASTVGTYAAVRKHIRLVITPSDY